MAIYSKGGSLSFPNAEVWATGSTTPTAYTDLDLSAVVGARICLVLIRGENNTGNSRTTQFRQNGDVVEGSSTGMIGTVNWPTATHDYWLVMTDAAGIIEWKKVGAETGVILKVMAVLYV